MYRQTVEREPHHLTAYKCLARTYQAMGEYAKALPYLEKMSELAALQTAPALAKRLGLR